MIEDNPLKSSIRVIKKAVRETKKPLIINFSGGKDSIALLHLVKKITDNFICFYCDSGIEFPGTLEAIKKTAKSLELDLLISNPEDHKRNFPNFQTAWCSRDLKWRPQKKVLEKEFEKGVFYKLNAVRKNESSRRNKIYKGNDFFKPDYDTNNDIMVFPLLNWNTSFRDRFIEKNEIKIPTKNYYKKYGVSSCYWCRFYQAYIYIKVLKDFPNLYNDFIKWEKILNKPSVAKNIWLSNLKKTSKNQNSIIKYI